MAEKKGNEFITQEIPGKSEETGDNITNEEAPGSLETVPSETLRNGVQTVTKDKAKSKTFPSFIDQLT